MSPLAIPDHVTFEKDQADPATEEQIAAAEKQLGRKIPGPYRELLPEHNGCRVDPPNFKMPKGSSSPHGSVSWFLGVGPDLDESLQISAIAEMYEGRVPSELVPIARDPGGNLICMNAGGTVFFWNHEFEDEDEDEEDGEPSGDNVQEIAEDFESFLASLEE